MGPALADGDDATIYIRHRNPKQKNVSQGTHRTETHRGKPIKTEIKETGPVGATGSAGSARSRVKTEPVAEGATGSAGSTRSRVKTEPVAEGATGSARSRVKTEPVAEARRVEVKTEEPVARARRVEVKTEPGEPCARQDDQVREWFRQVPVIT